MVGAPGYASGKSCLLVCSSSEPTSARTLAHAFYRLEGAGILTNFASPEGKIILSRGDPGEDDEVVRRFRADKEAQSRLERPIFIERAFGVKGISFDGAFLPGGPDGEAHSDIPACPRALGLLQHMALHGKTIGACGSALGALVPLTTPAGKPFLKGRTVAPTPEDAGVVVDTSGGGGPLITAQRGPDVAAAMADALATHLLSNKVLIIP